MAVALAIASLTPMLLAAVPGEGGPAELALLQRPHRSTAMSAPWSDDVGAGGPAPSAAIGESAPAGPRALPSPLLGTYDPSALLVPTGGTHPLYPQASLWNGTGEALAAGATLQWIVSPTWLGVVSSTGGFTAGTKAGSGIVTAVASWNGTSATDQMPVTVYAPVCILLSLDLPSRVVLETGANLTLAPRWLDQTGGPCSTTPSPVWQLTPGSFGSLTVGAGGTAVLHVNASAGDGWVTATGFSAGASRTATLQVSVVPPSAGAVIDLSPGSARLTQGETLSFSAPAEDGWGATPAGTYLWTLQPASLGTLTSGGDAASFTAGAGAGTGWLNVTFYSRDWGVLTASAVLRDLGPPGPDPLTGLYAPYLQSPPLLPGQGILLTLYGTDATGGLLSAGLNLTWQVVPAGLGRITTQGSQAVFVAGPRAGAGTVLAVVNRSGAANLTVPFPVSVVDPGVSSVALYGGPTDRVPAGGFTYLEGVDQDLFGNLLLAGGFYGLQYAAMNVSWKLLPGTMGILIPTGNGTSQDLPETAIFDSGGYVGNGQAVETLQWAGLNQSVDFPIQVYTQTPAAIAVIPPSTATPYGGVFENAPAVLTSIVLDQGGSPMFSQGNFSWQLAPGSDATIAGSPLRSQVSVTAGSAPGIVMGNLTWHDGSRSATEEFLFDVVAPPSNATTIAITPGGASAAVNALLGRALVGSYGVGTSIEPWGSALTVGTTQVPRAQGPAQWSMSPSTLGTLSNTVGREVNVTLTGTASQGWVNASIVGPDGTLFQASWPLFTYHPRLAYVQDLTGPCVGSCSEGLATFAGNNAYVALAPYDQVGRSFGQVQWSASLSLPALGRPLWTGWGSGAGSELFEVEANATAGNATFAARVSAGPENLSVALPLVVLPSWLDLAPLAPTGLRANATSNEVALNWTAPADLGSGRFENYTVQWVEGNGSTVENLSDPTWTSLVFSPALPGTTYHFRVRAWNSIGLAGPWTPWVVVHTWRAAPPPYLVGPSAEGFGITVFLLPAALAAAALVPFVGEYRRQRAARALKPPSRAVAPPFGGPPPAPPGPPGPGH